VHLSQFPFDAYHTLLTADLGYARSITETKVQPLGRS
jgi:hypothetical protein